jgi:hypothetical protein|tara:strand:- start:997 stop:1545 length:549 start_codon:yes stop_codon:yes gene_type:complete
MSDDGDNAQDNLGTILFNPSSTLASWYFWLGLLGLMLAVLNIMGVIHPSYRVSWGGLLTFEYTNDAFGDKDGAPLFVVSDAVFMAFVGGMTFLGARGLIGDGDPVEWLKGVVTNDWYNNLLNVEAGWTLVLGTWSMLASIVFYFYWGIMHMAWIDPGVYSIAIALMATGLVMRMLSSVEDEE